MLRRLHDFAQMDRLDDGTQCSLGWTAATASARLEPQRVLIVHRPSNPEETAAAVLAAMQDERLNLRARGLLGLLLSHAGEEWSNQNMDGLARDISQRQRALTGIGSEGRDAVRRTLGELEALGYLVRRRGGQGSFPQLFIEVFHTPGDVDIIPMPEGSDEGCEVYVVGGRDRSVVKIGTTKNLQSRVKTLQSGYPLQLEVLWHRPGGWALEQYLHKCFAKYRLEGEWFDFGKKDPVDEVLREVAKKYPDEFPDWPVPAAFRTDSTRGA